MKWIVVLMFCCVVPLAITAQYHEAYRPQYHLSSRASSMADPKGLFIYEGKYHIFWYGQWEHAVSEDLVHWEEWPRPMQGAPSLFSYFSGSVVVDTANTAGFGKDAAVAIYTRHFPGDSLPETQAISISHNGGKSFQYYAGNPIIDIGKKVFRDPQVFWYPPDKKWKMVVALSDQHQISIYESADLKSWTFCSNFGPLGAKNAFWECPDLFEVPVQGTREKKWVMIIGRGPNRVQYFTGDFDGKAFTPDQQLQNYLQTGIGLKGEVYEDFETADTGKWKIKGDAFLPKHKPAYGSDYLGNGFAGNLSKENATGTMRSRPFRVNRRTINFLIAGARNYDSLCIRLVAGDKVVRTTTGFGPPVFKWSGWDVRDLYGREVVIEVLDLDSSSKGTLAIDHIMFSDALMNTGAEQALWLDYGDDFYATRTWRNYDKNKHLGDSVLLISWLGNWQYARLAPTSWGTGFQSVPRNVTLRKFAEGLRVVQEPLPVLKQLRGDSISMAGRTIRGVMPVKGIENFENTYEMEVVFKTGTTGAVGLNLLVGDGRSLPIRYDPALSSLSIDRTNCTDFTTNPEFTKRFATKMFAPVEAERGEIKLHIFVDRSSVEVFTSKGSVVLSAATYPSRSQTSVELFSEADNARLMSLKVWRLHTIW